MKTPIVVVGKETIVSSHSHGFVRCEENGSLSRVYYGPSGEIKTEPTRVGSVRCWGKPRHI